MAFPTKCPSCKEAIHPGDATGVSGLYNPGPGRDILLCEECWFAEEDAVDAAGTNVLPELLRSYF